MSLGIAFKGPEGIVLAADSRVTLTLQQAGPEGSPTTLIPCTFDNATKLLRVDGCPNVGVVTYGLGAVGNFKPRTAHSYISEFEEEIERDRAEKKYPQGKNYTTEEFANKLSDFFAKRWLENKMPPAEKYQGPAMIFLIAGFDEGVPYGKVFEVQIPNIPVPQEWHKDNFGPVWGGQQEIVTRLLNGCDPQLLPIVQKHFNKTDAEMIELKRILEPAIQMPIPYMFLALQDCINLSILLIQTTLGLQSYSIGIRGVGGEIDVATITRSGGFQLYREKPVTKFHRRESGK